jgi:hypothetical protein
MNLVQISSLTKPVPGHLSVIPKEAKPFRNRGWVHLESVSVIMPATVRGVNVFCPSQGLTGLEWGYNGEDHDTPGDTLEASQQGPATQGTATEGFENGVVPDETLDLQSQVMVSASVPFISKSNILILSSACPCCLISPLACCLCFLQA